MVPDPETPVQEEARCNGYGADFYRCEQTIPVPQPVTYILCPDHAHQMDFVLRHREHLNVH